MSIISRKTLARANRSDKLRTSQSQPYRKAGFRPRLEPLEDRLAPAMLTVNDFVDRNTSTRFSASEKPFSWWIMAAMHPPRWEGI